MSTQFFLYPKATNASTTPQMIARKLDELLVAAGWSRSFVNAAAIGTGTAGSPKFDSVAFASGVSFGIVQYLMPLSTLANRWVIEVEWKWGSSNSQLAVTLRTATAGDASGNLTGASAARGLSAGSWNGTTTDVILVANEHEFWLANNSFRLGAGRARSMTGGVQDDLIVYGLGGTAASLSGFSTTSGSHSIRRNWAGGESSDTFVDFNLTHTGSSTYAPATTVSTVTPNVSYPIGPRNLSGGRSAEPRLYMEMASGDAVYGAEQSFLVDGQTVVYYCMDGTGTLGTGSRSLFAKG